ncbi:MAG: hypothetical protein CL678_01085 [Bdellovibrionaceae bacterium]|nr:hypothetical protein [Pseudobdellovibrionaceae bacterium]|tara:strand:+ start:525 stop:1547 length:1023 start_codon:yes stop_codon:yes gene_type:complete
MLRDDYKYVSNRTLRQFNLGRLLGQGTFNRVYEFKDPDRKDVVLRVSKKISTANGDKRIQHMKRVLQDLKQAVKHSPIKDICIAPIALQILTQKGPKETTKTILCTVPRGYEILTKPNRINYTPEAVTKFFQKALESSRFFACTDLKVPNLMLTKDGQIKIYDFDDCVVYNGIADPRKLTQIKENQKHNVFLTSTYSSIKSTFLPSTERKKNFPIKGIFNYKFNSATQLQFLIVLAYTCVYLQLLAINKFTSANTFKEAFRNKMYHWKGTTRIATHEGLSAEMVSLIYAQKEQFATMPEFTGLLAQFNDLAQEAIATISANRKAQFVEVFAPFIDLPRAL